MSHNHSHSVVNLSKKFKIGIILNLVYVAVEFTFGILSSSMALIADAGHNLGDILGLLLAWGASQLAKAKPTENRTYGYRKSTILAAFFNSIFLLIAVGAILIESIRRFAEPEPVAGTTMIFVAAAGVIINGATALIFFKGKDHDINVKGAFLHMAADAAVSLGVAAGGIAILFTGLIWIDPAISLFIVLIITISTWGLLKDSFLMSVDAVPKGIRLIEIRDYFLSLDGVKEVHDLHVWGMSTTEIALTVHLVMPDIIPADNFLKMICKDLHDKFEIDHPTIQIEKNAQAAKCQIENI